MDITKALGIAKSLKNHFRAFEELEAFVNAVAASQNYMAEFESRKAAIQEEIAVLEGKKRDMGKMEVAHAELEVKIKKAQNILDGLNAGVAEIKEKLG